MAKRLRYKTRERGESVYRRRNSLVGTGLQMLSVLVVGDHFKFLNGKNYYVVRSKTLQKIVYEPRVRMGKGVYGWSKDSSSYTVSIEKARLVPVVPDYA